MAKKEKPIPAAAARMMNAKLAAEKQAKEILRLVDALDAARRGYLEALCGREAIALPAGLARNPDLAAAIISNLVLCVKHDAMQKHVPPAFIKNFINAV